MLNYGDNKKNSWHDAGLKAFMTCESVC